jgi:hypothetical protein
VPANNEARKREIVLHPSVLLGVTAVEDALHTFPQFARDQRLVLARVYMAIPLEQDPAQ